MGGKCRTCGEQFYVRSVPDCDEIRVLTRDQMRMVERQWWERVSPF